MNNYHTKQFQKCKYCENEAKRQILSGGRNKGHYRTCGSEKCLTEQYRDLAVNRRKRCVENKICTKCNENYTATSPAQKWCKKCVPDKSSRGIIQRYNLSFPQYQSLLVSKDGNCFICLKRKAKVVDHDHKTGKVRGLLCNPCNMSLNLVEQPEILERALQYLDANL